MTSDICSENSATCSENSVTQVSIEKAAPSGKVATQFLRIGLSDDGAETIISRLKAGGFFGYYAGGCVRDALLSRKIYDFDLATNASPNEIKKIFYDCRLDLKGEKFGTVGIIINGKEYETTSFRSDLKYDDCRHPESVAFAAGINEDAARRDFSCNALYYNNDSGIIDPTGGLRDIKSGIIRAVGRAEERFNEDALRILRALRFASSLGFEIEKETVAALEKCANKIEYVSKERVFCEIKRVLEGEFAVKALENYNCAFFAVIDELKSVYDRMGNALFAPLKKSKNDFCLRFALLCRDLPLNVSERALKNLKADKKSVNGVMFILNNVNADFSSDISLKKLLAYMGKTAAENVIMFKACVAETKDESEYFNGRIAALNKLLKENAVYSLKGLAVNGNDLSDIGITGKKTGAVLNYLLEKVISGEIINEKNALLSKAKNFGEQSDQI